jgi:FtsP/CotA-like multicopper oxidase with cupredoxin domain
MAIDRRTLLRWLGLGGGAGLVGGGVKLLSTPAVGEVTGHDAHVPGGARGLAGRYGTMADPPEHLGPMALDHLTNPPPYRPATKEVRTVSLRAMDTSLEVGHGAVISALTYDGTSPGPIIRATQGELIDVTLLNATSRPHTLHFHGSFDTTEDGWQPVPPGEERTLSHRGRDGGAASLPLSHAALCVAHREGDVRRHDRRSTRRPAGRA